MVITSETKEGVAFVTMLGRLMFDESIFRLREHVAHLLAAGTRRFVFDMSGVPHCDSSGCGEIIGAYTSIKKAGGNAAFVNPSERVRIIWERIKLADVFPVFSSLAEGDAFVRSSPM